LIKSMSDNIKKILAPLAAELESVDRSIRSHIETGVALIDNSSMHLFAKGGKKIRASLVLLASGLRGSINPEAINLAAAVEIIHAASLVHDDIIDKSFLRRGDISVPGKYGDKIAVLAGDYLYALAVNIAVKDGDKRILNSISDSTTEMVKGELYQIEYSNIDKISEEHYYKIIERKTGRLMATSSFMGGVKGGCSDAECNELYMLGLELGYAFQIVDDTLDFSDSAVTGKDAGNDFKDGKITLPFIYLLNKCSIEERERVKNFARNPDESLWPEVKKMVSDSGALKYSFDKAAEYAEEARKRLDHFPESVYNSCIKDIISFIVNRSY